MPPEPMAIIARPMYVPVSWPSEMANMPWPPV
jgi:hypothetical protein